MTSPVLAASRGVVGDGLHVDALALDVARLERGLGDGEQLVDEVAHVLDLLTQVGERFLLLLGRVLFEDANGHLQPRQRRAQLVGDVAERAFLAGDEAFEPRAHAVDGRAELADFIGALVVHAHVELAVGNLPGGARELRDAACDAADERQPEEPAHRDHARAKQHPRTIVEEKPTRSERAGAREQCATQMPRAAGAGPKRAHQPDPVGPRVFRLHEEAAVNWRGAGWLLLAHPRRAGSGGFHGRAFLATRTFPAGRREAALAELVRARHRTAPVWTEPLAAAWRTRKLGTQGFRQVHFLAGECLQFIAQQDELHAVGVAVAREDAVPFSARLGFQFAQDGARG